MHTVVSLKRKAGTGFGLLCLLLFAPLIVAHAAPSDTPTELAAALELINDHWPLSAANRPTTAGDIYLDNLHGQLAALTARYQRHLQDRDLARLALLRYHRFQVLGNLADAEIARDLLQAQLERPHDPAIDLALVQILLGFHDFAQAGKLLDRVAATGSHPQQVERWRQRMSRMTRPRSDTIDPSNTTDHDDDPVALVMAADRSRQQGNLAQASRLLRQAQESYNDTAPYLLAWIHTQQGILFLEADEIEAANRFFRAAYERFPQYALAREHLAETELVLGNHVCALEHYVAVYAQTQHPEFLYRQAVAERALGMKKKADRHAAQARSEYLALVKRYPLMYADHAARYFHETGDAGQACMLALLNTTTRKNESARELFTDLGCELAANNWK